MRDALEADPARWLREILPDVFFADFSPSQLDFIKIVWDSLREGSWRNVEAYRGFGKTSILSGLLLKALCEGLVRHALYVTAEGGASVAQAADWFYAALYDDYEARGDDRRLFTRLYPEIGYPLQRREGKAQRPLTCDGVPLQIEMKADRIVLPNVPGARCRGSLLRFASISGGGLRGANRTIPGVGSFRVRAVMLDDIQSDAVAASDSMCASIMKTIQKTIRGLSGRRADGTRESLTVLSAITQNAPGDVAERMIEETPEFGTVVIPFVTSVPDNFDAWRAYRDFRESTLRASKSPAEARAKLREYFVARRDELSRNVAVDDPRSREEWQVDAIHYALDYWAASETSFWCEFQNDARRGVAETGGGLTAIEVARKRFVNAEGTPIRRCWVPSDADVLVAHIDAGEHYLNYEVVAYPKDFRFARVVDFGVFPEQPDGLASKSRFVVDLQDVYERGDKFDKLRDATIDCLLKIFEQQYFDERGKPIDVDVATPFEQHARPRGRARKRFARLAICGVDCSDGEMELALWSAIDAFHRIDGGRFLGRAIPAYGVESSSRLMRYYDLKPGEWRRDRRTGRGYDWIENAIGRASVARGYPNVYASLTYDANTAKTRRDAAWKLPADRDGAATLFYAPEAEEEIAQFARHQTAEEFVATTKSGIEYRRWRMKKPKVSDNEFLDTDAACRALAEYVGCEVESVERRADRPVERRRGRRSPPGDGGRRV